MFAYIILFFVILYIAWVIHEATRYVHTTPLDRSHLIRHHKVINELLHKNKEAEEQQDKADINHEETK